MMSEYSVSGFVLIVEGAATTVLTLPSASANPVHEHRLQDIHVTFSQSVALTWSEVSLQGCPSRGHRLNDHSGKRCQSLEGKSLNAPTVTVVLRVCDAIPGHQRVPLCHNEG